MEFKASHRFARISARKVRDVAALVRRRPAEEAVEVLTFVHNRGATMLSKVLRSAIANAGTKAPADELWIREVRVNEGPTLPMRWQPGPRGAAMPIRKRTSHIMVVLTDQAGE